MRPENWGCGDPYKIDYSALTGKNRCVAGIGYIA